MAHSKLSANKQLCANHQLQMNILALLHLPSCDGLPVLGQHRCTCTAKASYPHYSHPQWLCLRTGLETRNGAILWWG